MTREEAKQLLPIIQAFSEGKTIEQRCAESWVEVDKDCDFHFPANYYRIKPESKYRPFKNAEECWKEMLKHQPLGWTKDRDNNKTFVGSVNTDNTISMGSSEVLFLEDTFKDFTFDDGTPFGIREC